MTFDEYAKSIPEMSIPRKEFLREHWDAIRATRGPSPLNEPVSFIEIKRDTEFTRDEFFKLVYDLAHMNPFESRVGRIVEILNKHGIKDSDHELRTRKEERAKPR